MTPFRDQPIARKALILGLVPTICALIIASAAFLLSTFVSIRRSVLDDISTSAAVIADSVNVALSFNDASTAGELVAALREKRNIDRVCIFDGTGRYFAGYAAPGQSCPPAIEPSPELSAAHVVALHPVL